MNSRQISSSLLRKIEKKRFYRKIRSRTKRRLRRGGIVGGQTRRKYNLYRYDTYKSVRWKAAHSKLERSEVKVPVTLSFFKNPEATSRFFASLNYGLERDWKNQRPTNFYVSHEKTKELGLAESFLFDSALNRQKSAWAKKNIPIYFSGKISTASKQVNNFLLSFGLLKELSIKADFSSDAFDQDYENKYVTFKMTGSRLNNLDKGAGSFKLIEYFDTCLQYNGFKIKDSAKAELVAVIGEIIGNAEEHCGNQKGEWHALGCYNKESHSCAFAIINFGKTIYENLSDTSSTAVDVIKDVEEIVLSNRTYMQIFASTFKEALLNCQHQEEPVWNVMALQDGISSKRTTSGVGSTRGQGIMDFLEFIDEIKTEGSAELFMLSGHSLIKIDYSYPIMPKLVGMPKEKRRIMAFNTAGDLQQPSDNQKVVYLQNKFNGTVFGGNFRISKEYLIKQQEQGN